MRHDALPDLPGRRARRRRPQLTDAQRRQAVLAMAETHYGPLPPSDKIKPRLRPAEPPQLAERRLVLRDERVAQPYVARSYLAPQRKSGDQKEAAALTMLAQLLGGNRATSVLPRALEFDQKVATYTQASYDGVSLDQTTFTLAVVPADGVSLDQVEKAMDAVILSPWRAVRCAKRSFNFSDI